MTYQEIAREMNKLSLNEQLSLLQLLVTLIRQSMPQRSRSNMSLMRVRGLLKPTVNKHLPTDAELSNDYTDYLLKKYA